MKKILLLLDKTSDTTKQADSSHLLSLLQANNVASFECAYYEDISFHISNAKIDVTIGADSKKIDAFDVIYFRRFNTEQSKAIAIAQYAKHKGIRIVDAEIANRNDSVSKLTQYIKLALANLPIPETFCTSQARLSQMAQSNTMPIKYPFVMKMANASRGEDNALIRTSYEAEVFITNHPRGEVLVQEFIDNHGDYRVWVLGRELGPVFHRQRDFEKGTHKNNTSLGARMSQVTNIHELDQLKDMSIKAALLMGRDVAGVDIVKNANNPDDFRIFEVNRSPQIEHTQMEDLKAHALGDYLASL